MAAKKKPAPSKSNPQAKPAPSVATAKRAPVKGKPAPPPKAAKLMTTAKPSKPGKPEKPTKAVKGAPTKPTKPTKEAKPAKSSSPAKPAKKLESASRPKRTQDEQPSIVRSVQRAAAKVVQAAAQAAMKILEPDMGRPAPSFELDDEKGETVSSSDLAGKPYLLYFYPKDDTPGCTKEACDIRDNFGRFGERGIRVLGVSPDTTKSHAKFGQKYGLPFTLLSDPDKQLATAYGVWGEKNNYGKKYMGIIRSTFLVGPDGVIKKAYRGVKVDGHVSAILADADALL